MAKEKTSAEVHSLGSGAVVDPLPLLRAASFKSRKMRRPTGESSTKPKKDDNITPPKAEPPIRGTSGTTQKEEGEPPLYFN